MTTAVPPPGSSSGCGTGQHAAAGGRGPRDDRIEVGAAGHAKGHVAHVGLAAAVQGQDMVEAAGAAQVRGVVGLRHRLEVPGVVIEAFGGIEVGDADGDAAQLAGWG
jgi:hypothetical protein